MVDDRQAPNNNERAYQWIEKHPLMLLLLATAALIVMVVFYWAIGADSSPAWTGFGAYDEEASGPRAKTMWDWLGLLIVPLAVAIGAAVISYFQKRTELDIAKKARETEQKIATDRQMQAMLEAYYDRMTELLLERGLSKPETDPEIRSLARARTITVVRSLDSERNRQLFLFLISTNLISFRDPIIDLRDADFTSAQLMGVNLQSTRLDRANFSGAVLFAANLTQADLSSALLMNTSLQHAKLINTMLMGANLYFADLRYANLKGSVLVGAKLKFANLGTADLSISHLTASDLTKCDLRGANLTGAQLDSSILHDSDLTLAELGGANMRNASVEGAIFYLVNMKDADLSGIPNLTIEQLDQTKTLESATMPDGVKLTGIDNPAGPTYEEWKAQYLAKQGGS